MAAMAMVWSLSVGAMDDVIQSPTCSGALKYGDLLKVQDFQFSDGRRITTASDEERYAFIHVKAKPGAFNVPKAMVIELLEIRIDEQGYPKILAKLRHTGGSSRWLENFEVASLTPHSGAKRYFTQRLMIPATVSRHIKPNGLLK